MIKDYLKENQPLFYRIIENEFNLKKIPHAFLLVGNNTDQPLQFLTMSLICNETLACEQCIDCKKAVSYTHLDAYKRQVFIVFINLKNKKWLFYVNQKKLWNGMTKCGHIQLNYLEV